jgi:uncharacterized membrane protein
MIPFPSPLHPAVVHFPIVLLILGMAVAVVAVFVRRWHLPWLVALMLVAGALGAVVATVTGGEDEEMVDESLPNTEQVLEMHEEWGETTRNAAIAAAVLAVAAALTANVRVAGRSLSVLTALVALAAAYSVAQAGHYGGELVYRHGAGVNTTGSTGASGTQEAEGQKSGETHEKDDD